MFFFFWVSDKEHGRWGGTVWFRCMCVCVCVCVCFFLFRARQIRVENKKNVFHSWIYLIMRKFSKWSLAHKPACARVECIKSHGHHNHTWLLDLCLHRVQPTIWRNGNIGIIVVFFSLHAINSLHLWSLDRQHNMLSVVCVQKLNNKQNENCGSIPCWVSIAPAMSAILFKLQH